MHHGHTLGGKQPSMVSPHFTWTKCKGKGQIRGTLDIRNIPESSDPRSPHQLQRGPVMMLAQPVMVLRCLGRGQGEA